ncbi:MAG TPA: ferric reductase-like transmembrane domain-containing protein [Dehalococcoidia bacterium]|nr:ferric reductase-like transmembrane domain-containing protein [Dehalococcoidia bacterium]
MPFLPSLPDWGYHTYWYLGRAGGFVAFGLLLASIVLGLAISSRLFDGVLARPWFFEMHRFLSLFVIVAILFHALIMLPDPYASFTPRELLLPFQSHIKNVAMSLGVFALYGSALVSFSFYVTRWIGQKTWRLLHYLTFPVFVLGLAHGILAGTDTGLQEVQAYYTIGMLLVIFFLLYRILAVRSQKSRTPRHAAEPSRAHAPDSLAKPAT